MLVLVLVLVFVFLFDSAGIGSLIDNDTFNEVEGDFSFESAVSDMQFKNGALEGSDIAREGGSYFVVCFVRESSKYDWPINQWSMNLDGSETNLFGLLNLYQIFVTTRRLQGLLTF